MPIVTGFVRSFRHVQRQLSIRAILSGVLLLCLFLGPSIARGAEDSDGSSAKVGFDIRRMHDQKDHPFWAGNIPTLTAGYPIANQYVQLELKWAIQWGFTRFYVDHFPDFLPSLGMRIYPFKKILSIHGEGGWGTFLFNNNTLTAETGGNLDIPIGGDQYKKAYLTIGVGYFYRKVYHVADYIHQTQWYITSPGVVFDVGLLIRTFE
jgi:hypothetical protein